MSEVALLAAVRGAAAEASAEARASGRAAIEQLLERNYDWIMRMCLAEFGNSAIAQDCCQEVLLRISKGLHSFKGDSKLTTWIFVILKRTVADVRRKAIKQHQRFSLEGDQAQLDRISTEADTSTAQSQTPERKLIADEKRERLIELIRSLPDKQRTAVLLHYFEDLSVEQAAERIGCSVSSLKTHLFRARKKLSEAFDELGEAL
ncbi:MAG: RNA polymerase sigma factor [Bdellovibrionales bacterium]|nr:RNA polymerase sigma factor [Bdellovibrionales bacterium]